ncbi:unnamed protein product [Peniophora sp. CBMAI 1063]|nr:unnamed protein product [Peniophora sp. CBMAI 1063]
MSNNDNTAMNMPEDAAAVAAANNEQNEDDLTLVDQEDILLVNVRRLPVPLSTGYRTFAQMAAVVPTYCRPLENQSVSFVSAHAAGDDDGHLFYGPNVDMGPFTADTFDMGQLNFGAGAMEFAQLQGFFPFQVVESAQVIVNEDELDETEDMEVEEVLDVEDDEHDDV